MLAHWKFIASCFRIGRLLGSTPRRSFKSEGVCIASRSTSPFCRRPTLKNSVAFELSPLLAIDRSASQNNAFAWHRVFSLRSNSYDSHRHRRLRPHSGGPSSRLSLVTRGRLRRLSHHGSLLE